MSWPPRLWPESPNLEAVEVWQRLRMGSFLANFALTALGTTAMVVVRGTGCGYALARVRSRWMDVIPFSILMMQVLPSSLMITPTFVAFSQFGLLDYPRLSVILAQAAKVLPFYIVLVRATFLQVPRELEEAALVNGNPRVGTFFRIVVPLARNGILVAALLVMLQALGEYGYSRSLIQERACQPATVGLQSFIGPNTSDWQGVMTYAAIYVTPVLLLFVLRQRVAMGRVIVRKPKAFLFDESLSNLDAAMRVHMRSEICKLHDRINATSVYLIHDQIEAMTMADHVVVMRAGRVEQQGVPLALYDRPINRFVAGFISLPAMNFVQERIVEDGTRVRLDLPVALVERTGSASFVVTDTAPALMIRRDRAARRGRARRAFGHHQAILHAPVPSRDQQGAGRRMPSMSVSATRAADGWPSRPRVQRRLHGWP